MDIYDVRQGRLRQLLTEKFSSVQKDLAEKIGVEPNYASRLLTNNKHRKRIGEDLARQIEERLKLPARWLDSTNSDQLASSRIAEPSTKLYNHDVTEEGVIFAKEWERLSAPLRAQVQTLVHTMVAEAVRISRGAATAPATPPKGPKAGPKTAHTRERRHHA